MSDIAVLFGTHCHLLRFLIATCRILYTVWISLRLPTLRWTMYLHRLALSFLHRDEQLTACACEPSLEQNSAVVCVKSCVKSMRYQFWRQLCVEGAHSLINGAGELQVPVVVLRQLSTVYKVRTRLQEHICCIATIYMVWKNSLAFLASSIDCLCSSQGQGNLECIDHLPYSQCHSHARQPWLRDSMYFQLQQQLHDRRKQHDQYQQLLDLLCRC